jgi:1-acyl-sn-glycerol-3-phosphate acyltransferase
MAMFIKPFEKMAATLNHIWAKLFFFFMFLNKTIISYEEKLDKNQTYIFCANHASYLDIPTVGLINHNFKFIGKSSLKKVPLWGYMYGKIHILVNRESMKSKYASLQKVREALNNGFSVVFFPEGGIVSKKFPQMGRFKEGSFRLAVEEKIPIVPITIPFNHKILPDKKPLNIKVGKVSIKVHKPIYLENNSEEAVTELKAKVAKIMQEELNKENNLSS